jgi:hypothetical protein
MSDLHRALAGLRALAWPVYFAGALTLLLPLADLLASVWPVRIGQLEWRFGSLGLLSGFTLSPVLGLIMCMAAAAVLEHWIVQRLLAVLSMIGAVLLVAMVVIFGFDWLQYRAAAPLEARPGMDTGSIKALAKHGLVSASLLWLGFASWRAGRRPRVPARAKRGSASLMRQPAQST